MRRRGVARGRMRSRRDEMDCVCACVVSVCVCVHVCVKESGGGDGGEHSMRLLYTLALRQGTQIRYHTPTPHVHPMYDSACRTVVRAR